MCDLYWCNLDFFGVFFVGFDLEVCSGEIFGIVGVVGNG